MAQAESRRAEHTAARLIDDIGWSTPMVAARSAAALSSAQGTPHQTCLLLPFHRLPSLTCQSEVWVSVTAALHTLQLLGDCDA